MSEVQFDCDGCSKLVRIVIPLIELGGSKKTVSCNNCSQMYVFEMSLWMELSTPKYKNKEWLFTKYIIEEKSMSEIARICGKSAMTIRKWLIKHDIPTRSVGQRRD
jgi:hypothetical protein